MSLSVAELDDGRRRWWRRLTRVRLPARLPRPGRWSAISCPQCIQSFAAGCRNRQGGHAEHVVRCSCRLRARSARDSLSTFVATTCRSTRHSHPASGPPRGRSRARDGGRRPAAAVTRRCVRRSSPEVRFRHRPQFVRRLRAAPRVAVARQVHEVQGPPPRAPRASLEPDPIEVRQPGLAGRRARARDLRPAQRVDQGRLADIRPAGQRDLRETVVRECRRPVRRPRRS